MPKIEKKVDKTVKEEERQEFFPVVILCRVFYLEEQEDRKEGTAPVSSHRYLLCTIRDPGRSHSTSFRRRVWRVKLIKPKQYIRNHGLAYLAPLFYRLKTCQGFICLQAIFTIFCLCLKVNFNYIFCILESYSNDIKT